MFLGPLLERRGRLISIVTTSNILPSDLGRGRFAAEAFQREIGELAEVTADVEDCGALRQAFAVDHAPDRGKVLLGWPRLASELEAVHPVHYAQIAAQLEALYVEDLLRIDQQADALRLNQFLDKLYDQEVRLQVAVPDGLALAEIFSAAYRHGGYDKKYRRGLSRLHELVSETKAVTPPPRRDTGRGTPPGQDPGALHADPAPAD